MSKRLLGDIAEQQAAEYLQQRGAAVLAKNYACRRGEIDIIIQDGDMIAFVEVRYRRRLSEAADSIDASKQRRLSATADDYLAKHGVEDVCYRFDVVTVDHEGRVNWIKDAFWAGADGG